ncbi:MAG: TetR/AcrR family transcriptional regulator [Candidatus Fermentibacteria bacterium]|nr:TetR/AcrR family transcriptional regulator [Candidatus Fermentibacteria bacterium]
MTELRKKQEINFRKNLIIDAAKIIFFDNGFENSTMEDIAHEAGYSKGSLYSYFNSKNEICFTIVNRYFLKIVDSIQEISERGVSGLQKLVGVKEAFVDEYAHNSQFCNIYETFKYHRSQCSEVENEIRINESYSRRIKELLVGIVQSGIDDNSIRATVDVKMLSQSFWNEKNCFIAETMFSKVNAYDYLFDLIIDSIRTPEDV